MKTRALDLIFTLSDSVADIEYHCQLIKWVVHFTSLHFTKALATRA